MCKFSEDSKQKLGNTIIFIAERTPQLSKTKLLKLLFLMEEYMVKRYHLPFLALPYEVWQAGPVAKDVFIDLSDGVVLLKDFIKTEVTDNAMYIYAIKPFCDDEFSECEIEMMDEVIKKHGNKTATQLVQEVHREGSLWYNVAMEHGLLEDFKSGVSNNSSFVIDFSKVLTECAKEDYLESLAIRQTANILKTQANV
jgi:uncharacterized phage-associated protein